MEGIYAGTYAHYLSEISAPNTNAPVSLADKYTRSPINLRDSLVWRQKFLRGNAHKS